MLTRRQKEVLDFVSRHIDKHGVAPTLHEIGRHLKLASVATVHKHLRKLEEKGAVRRLTHQSRAMSVVPKVEATAGALVPLLGTVAAGSPIEPIETPGSIAIPEELLGRGETFALRVKGDSMIEAGIHDGDYVFVRKQLQATPGEIVVAMIEDEATVKKYFPEGDIIRFQPANSSMKDIIVRKRDWKSVNLIGVVIGIYRKYS